MGLVTRQTGSLADGYWLPGICYAVVAAFGLLAMGRDGSLGRGIE
jgi:hypothetical protein